MIHFLLPGITRSYSDFPVKAGTDQNQDYCHKLVIRLHRVGIKPCESLCLLNCAALKFTSMIDLPHLQSLNAHYI